jgi:hypothetical protein
MASDPWCSHATKCGQNDLPSDRGGCSAAWPKRFGKQRRNAKRRTSHKENHGFSRAIAQPAFYSIEVRKVPASRGMHLLGRYTDRPAGVNILDQPRDLGIYCPRTLFPDFVRNHYTRDFECLNRRAAFKTSAIPVGPDFPILVLLSKACSS